MKKLALSAVLLALGIAGASAQAQVQVPRNQRYCLEAGGPDGLEPLLCRFETLEQCFASKTAPSDNCMLNPVLAFQRRR